LFRSPHCRADRRDVQGNGHRQLRGPLRHPDRPPRARRGCLRSSRILRLLVRQRMLGRAHGAEPVPHAEKGQDTDGGRMMRETLKTLSALLTYPTAELQAAVPAMRTALDRESVVPRATRDRIALLLDAIAAGDIYDIQERYVLLFDRTRSLSLHLFEHVHGESRDRGQAMVDLAQLYEKHGLAPSTSELPDFIPL